MNAREALSKSEIQLITHHLHHLSIIIARIDDDKIRGNLTKMVRRNMQELKHKTHLLNMPLPTPPQEKE